MISRSKPTVFFKDEASQVKCEACEAIQIHSVTKKTTAWFCPSFYYKCISLLLAVDSFRTAAPLQILYRVLNTG